MCLRWACLENLLWGEGWAGYARAAFGLDASWGNKPGPLICCDPICDPIWLRSGDEGLGADSRVRPGLS